MEKIVYLSYNENYHSDIEALSNEYQIKKVSSLKETIIYLIDQPDASLIISNSHETPEINQKTLKLIYQLNPFLPFIFIQSEISTQKENDLKKRNRNVVVINSTNKIKSIIEHTKKNRRKFNRTEWPLSAVFYTDQSPDYMETGKVLSLSAGGAYIKTTEVNFDTGQLVYLEISFKDFKFFVEGNIIRLNKELTDNKPLGFAVQFKNISNPTQKVINRIIKDHILEQLLVELQSLE